MVNRPKRKKERKKTVVEQNSGTAIQVEHQRQVWGAAMLGYLMLLIVWEVL